MTDDDPTTPKHISPSLELLLEQSRELLLEHQRRTRHDLYKIGGMLIGFTLFTLAGWYGLWPWRGWLNLFSAILVIYACILNERNIRFWGRIGVMWKARHAFRICMAFSVGFNLTVAYLRLF